jgi:aarF domain-containing kinase
VPGDLRLIRWGTDVATWIFPDFKYGWLPDEFEQRLPKELDFTCEAKNADRSR